MLMVDQCWLWILNGSESKTVLITLFMLTRTADTILTCFPQRWGTLGGDASHSEVIEQLLQPLDHEKTRNKITQAKDLAYFIIDRCARNVLDPNALADKRVQFLEFFNKSIRDPVSSIH